MSALRGYDVLTCLRVVLKDVMTKANTCVSLIKLGFKSNSIHKRREYVVVGVAAKFEMQELLKKKEVYDTQCLKFINDTILLLFTLCAHMAEKSPLIVALARHSRCFIPGSLVENPSISERRFSSLLEVRYIKDQITNSSAEERKNSLTSYEW